MTSLLNTLRVRSFVWLRATCLSTLTVAIVSIGSAPAFAETGYDAWLRYAEIRDASAVARYEQLPAAAEELELAGYRMTAIEPWEAASGSEAVEVPAGADSGELRLTYDGESGWYEVRIQYFDEEDGVSSFEAYLNDQPLDHWIADQYVPTPTTKPDAHSSIRRTIRGVPLRPGDVVRIIGKADGDEHAAIDYLELIPEATSSRRVAQQAEP